MPTSTVASPFQRRLCVAWCLCCIRCRLVVENKTGVPWRTLALTKQCVVYVVRLLLVDLLTEFGVLLELKYRFSLCRLLDCGVHRNAL